MATRRYVTISDSPIGGEDANYLTFAAMLTGESHDLVTADVYLDVEVYDKQFSAIMLDSSWITSDDCYIHIYAADDHLGVWASDVARVVNTGSQPAVTINANHVELEGLQISQEYSGSSTARDAIRCITQGVGWTKLTRCLIRQNNGASTGNNNGIFFGDSDQMYVVRGCIIYGFATHASAAGIRPDGISARIYNTTVVGCSIGIQNEANDTIVRNTRCTGNQYADFAGVGYATGSSHNLSSDASAPGANSLTMQIGQYIDEPNKDFHITPSDPGVGAGTDLSGVTYAVTHDIDNQLISSWDIGADTDPEGSAQPTLTLLDPIEDVTMNTGTLYAEAEATEADGVTDASDGIEWTSDNPNDGTGGVLGTGGLIGIDVAAMDEGAREITATYDDGVNPPVSGSFTLTKGTGGTGPAGGIFAALAQVQHLGGY